MTKLVKEKQCPNCHGEGFIQVYDLGYSFRGSSEKCSYCDGTGIISDKMLAKYQSYNNKSQQ
jgi:DnaJ-class molecular chaperone